MVIYLLQNSQDLTPSCGEAQELRTKQSANANLTPSEVGMLHAGPKVNAVQISVYWQKFAYVSGFGSAGRRPLGGH